MKRKHFVHFIGLSLFIIIATLSVFTTMFVSYRSYSDKIENAAPQIHVGMPLTEVEKLLGKADNAKSIDERRYLSWSSAYRYSRCLEKFDLANYEDYSHLNIVVDFNGNIVGLY